MRRAWIVLINLICMALMIVSLSRDLQISSYGGAKWTSAPLRHGLGVGICILVLALGVVLEIRKSRAAMLINVGFFAILGLTVLIQSLINTNIEHPSERALAIAVVGVPFSFIAVINGFLYACEAWRRGVG